MMISHRHRCIFAHIPKCAGSSINAVLDLKAIIPPYWHCSWQEACEAVGEDIMEGYFKFSFVRNPWERVVSAWQMFRHKPWCKQKNNYTLQEFLHIVLDDSIGYRAFYRTDDEKDEWMHTTENVRHHTLPCFHPYYGMVDEQGRIKMNFVGRFESLSHDFKAVCTRLGISGLTLPRKNRTLHRHYGDYYDSKSVDRVRHYYRNDINHFQYRFEHGKSWVGRE